MSAIRMAYHLDEASKAIAVAIDHLRHAEEHDVDPRTAGPVYGNARTGLRTIAAMCGGLIGSRQPDLDRERAAIDAEREAG